MVDKRKSKKRRSGQEPAQLMEKELKCLELRLAGWDYKTIARNTGYQTGAGAYKAVMRAIQNTLKEPAQEVRNMELRRLDDMMTAQWLAATQGNTKAVETILKIMDRRAKLMGLDKEKIQVEHKGSVNLVWNAPSILPQETPPKKLSPAQKPS